MADPLISLIKIAGITLVITILWALTLTTAYWDIQRRNNSGERVNLFAWMALVGFLPFMGWIIYRISRLLLYALRSSNQAPAKPRSRGETQLLQVLPQAGVAPVTSTGTEIGTISSLDRTVPLPPKFEVAVMSGPEQGKRFVIDKFPVQIGRDFNSIIRLDKDTGVSRKHALIYLVDDEPHIRDLQSLHGTQVNGKRVTDEILELESLIEVGMSTLMVRKVDAGTTPAPG